MTYYIGKKVQVTATFTLNDVNTSPTTVVTKVVNPDGTETSPTATNTAPGIFSFDVLLDKAGDWYFRVTASGIVFDTVYTKLYVKPTPAD